MTRAPRSANWRVANGAAMACSRVTTVMPASGCMMAPLADDCGGIHRQPALVIAGPEMERLAVRLRLAADEEVVGIERRAHRAKLVARDFRIGQLMPQQVEQQRRDQRSVHDEPR